jgi:hypothetical protein
MKHRKLGLDGQIEQVAPRGAAAGERYNEAMVGLLNG